MTKSNIVKAVSSVSTIVIAIVVATLVMSAIEKRREAKALADSEAKAEENV